jgi:hypothetical protein
MANRIPLIVDTDDGNKLKELPIGDNLNLTGSNIVGVSNIAATSLTIAGVPYNPFSGSYADLTGTPTIPETTDDIVEGTKKYLTDERLQDGVAGFLVAGLGIILNYNDAAGTLTIEATGVGSGGGGGSTTLSGLTDVTLTAPSVNQILKYNGSAWVNNSIAYSEVTGRPNFATIATTGSYNDLSNKPIIPIDLDDLTDVDTTTTPPTNGQVLKWLENKWVPGDDITQGGSGLNADTLDGFDSSYFLDWTNTTNKPVYQISDLDDTSISNVTGNQILKWTGLTWINATNEPDFSNVQNTPTTLAGYGITDSPTALTDLGISDGSANGILKTDGSGNFSFVTSLSGLTLTSVASIGFTSGATINEFSTDTTLAGNSNTAIPTEAAVKAYVDANAGGGVVDGLASRGTVQASTSSIANDVDANITFTGHKAYALMSIETSTAAWVRLYISSAARIADASRGEGQDPAPDAGVIAEVLTPGARTVNFGPAVLGWNLANDTTIYAAVKNKSGGTATITTTLTLLKMEA